VNITTSYKSNQFLWIVFKLLTVILCGYFIYTIIAHNEKFKFIDFYSKLIDFDVFSSKNIIFLLFLSIINHFIEIVKWKILTNYVKRNSWLETTKQSLGSLTFSLITPNRIGEYGDKELYYTNDKRKQILLLNFAGNFYQLVITTILGAVGLVYLSTYFSFSIISIKNSSILILGITGLGSSICYLEKKSYKISHLISKIVALLSMKNNILVLFTCLLRYLVFTHQFYFFILCFKIDISYVHSISAISSMYLIASCIPILSLFDAALKGSVAVVVFSLFGIDSFLILSITTLMWLFNFAFPAIIGSYFVLQFNPIKP
jgi:hypothetical protein